MKNSKEKDLETNLDELLKDSNKDSECDLGDEVCYEKDKSLVEKIDKKIITQDGRQLLI
jgi:hypothetical protein